MRIRIVNLSQLLIFLGCFLFFVPIIQIGLMHYKRVEAISDWQVLKVFTVPFQDNRELLSVVYHEIPPEDTLFATLSYLEKEHLPIYQGIKSNQLKKGLGHDPLSVLPGENGNCLIYGHREEFFWELQNVNIGDLIFIQTLYETLTYEVKEIRVLDSQDTYIFEQKQIPELTLVTCHPFIFWGPIENRFIVRATLI